MTKASAVFERFKLLGLKRRVERRYDRCCHGGEIWKRLPLLFRIEAANHATPAYKDPRP